MRLLLLLLALWPLRAAWAADEDKWTPAAIVTLHTLDDDVARTSISSFDGLELSQYRFSENGFDWHLIRFRSIAVPHGPLWVVPHDDEDAAFDAMISALHTHGGVGIAVNSGPGSLRRQPGRGQCGVQRAVTSACDPNRNFDARSPLFTAAFLAQRPEGQPVIALHTNSPGFSGDGRGGAGDFTILNRAAYRRGMTAPREGGSFAASPQRTLANYDTLGLVPYQARYGAPGLAAAECGRSLLKAGVHFWHEPVRTSDGSLSNYLALNHPEIAYFNSESRAERETALAAERHAIMVASYLAHCARQSQAPVTEQPSPKATILLTLGEWAHDQ